MKQSFLVFFILFMGTTIAQIPAEITLHDGAKFEGFADITSKDKIEFRITLDEAPETFDGLDIIKVEFRKEPFGIYEYVYMKNRFKLLKIESVGEIIVYAQYPESFSTQKSKAQLKREDYINHDNKFFQNGVPPYPRGSLGLKKIRFWIKKSGENKVDDIRLNFRQEARIWFKNCPGLLKKIKSRELTYFDMIEVIDYYNDFCGEY